MPSITYHRGSGLPIIDVTVRYWPLHGVPHPSGTVPEQRLRALVDTGATHVYLQPSIVAALDLPFACDVDSTVVGGTIHKVPAYAGELLIGTPALGYTFPDLLVISQALRGDYDMLIGWGGLDQCDWTFDRSGTFTQSW